MAKSEQKHKTDKGATRKRVKKSVKQAAEKPILPYLLIGLAITALIIAAIEIDSYLKRNSTREVDTECDFCQEATAPISSKEKFKDWNETHLKHARRNGLDHPYKTNAALQADLDSLRDNGRLVEISDNKYYRVCNLTHSLPYLTPEAANLLQEIGIRFHAKLRKKDLARHKFEISSMLRTEETQKGLRRVNYQATHDETSHYYGTTFDIAYDKYERFGIRYQDRQLESLLTETLRELRRECRLLIVDEKRNKCYHITVVKCKNS